MLWLTSSEPNNFLIGGWQSMGMIQLQRWVVFIFVLRDFQMLPLKKLRTNESEFHRLRSHRVMFPFLREEQMEDINILSLGKFEGLRLKENTERRWTIFLKYTPRFLSRILTILKSAILRVMMKREHHLIIQDQQSDLMIFEIYFRLQLKQMLPFSGMDVRLRI